MKDNFNYSNKHDIYRVATVLPALSDAALFLQDQENKADFLRMLLNDFVKANAFPYDYTKLPESERLKRYFGVGKSKEEISKEVMESITKMENDKERLCLQIQYIKSYLTFRNIFIEAFPTDYCWLYFVSENTKSLTKDDIDGRGIEYRVVSDLKRFSITYEEKHNDAKYMAQLADKEKSIDTAEKLFIYLAHHWFFINDLLPEAREYSTEQVVELIVTFVKTYINFAPIDDIITMTSFTTFVKNNINNTFVVQV